jgi:hypothetical protein
MKLIAFLFLLATLPVTAQPGESVAGNGCYRYGVLLDPQAPVNDREEHLARLKTAAGNDESSAQHLLGTLYRLGPDHPASVVPHDAAQARHWLGKAARGGERLAMAALAELDLADGKPMDAMVWSQVMVHYSRNYPLPGSSDAPEYAADLIFRAQEALRSPAGAPRRRQSQAMLRANEQALKEEILTNFRAFLAAEGDAMDSVFRARLQADDQPRVEDPECPAIYDSVRWPLEVKPGAPVTVVRSRAARKLMYAGYGYFYVDVEPDGRVSRALMVDSLPGAEYGLGLQATVENLRFNAIEGAPLRVALVPMSFMTGAVTFKD